MKHENYNRFDGQTTRKQKALAVLATSAALAGLGLGVKAVTQHDASPSSTPITTSSEKPVTIETVPVEELQAAIDRSADKLMTTLNEAKKSGKARENAVGGDGTNVVVKNDDGTEVNISSTTYEPTGISLDLGDGSSVDGNTYKKEDGTVTISFTLSSPKSDTGFEDTSQNPEITDEVDITHSSNGSFVSLTGLYDSEPFSINNNVVNEQIAANQSGYSDAAQALDLMNSLASEQLSK